MMVACSCKHNQERIKEGINDFKCLRDLFIKRMTSDSDTNDRRRKDYNQAIFHYYTKEDVDEWNDYIDRYSLVSARKREYGQTFPVWCEIDMDMVLKCFDDAIKDWRKSWCDVDNCNRR